MSRSARGLFVAALLATAMSLFHADVVVAQDKSGAAASQPAPADDARPITDEDIEMLRKDIRSQRKQLIAANMKLTDTEAEKFWPVYDQYVSEQVSMNNKKYALIKQYVQTGGVLTDAEAESAVKQWVSVDESVAALRSKYIPI